MDGILIVDKPINCTSRDVVNMMCKKLKTKKIGHTGTLDPIATGVLILMIGKYTSLGELVTAYDKVYEAEVELGTLTDTLDITGNVVKSESCHISEEKIIETLKSMIGIYNQETPIYSAVKVNGKKLYEYARNNEKVELPIREVEIKNIELISNISYENNKTKFKIRCEVSKGTYIRSLINDIAFKLNTVGTMTSLRRLRQGKFTINEAYTIDEINNDNYQFVNLKKCFDERDFVALDEETCFKVKNGQALPNIYNKELVVFTYNSNIVAIYHLENNTLKMWKYLF